MNIREEPFPRADALWRFGSEWDLWLDDERHVMNLFYLGYFVRTYILSPDLNTLLNEQEGFWDMGATFSADAYLPILERSMARWKELQAAAARGS